MVKVVYPGTFDPVHWGHLDIVQRASKLFDKIYVAVAKSSKKNPLFSLEERVKLFREAVEILNLSPKVEVMGFDSLLIEFMKKLNVNTVIRGVRLFTDFEYELQISLTNYKLGEVETLFMMPSQELIHISSTIVKDIAKHGGCLKGLVPPNVEKALMEKFQLCGD
ncbi:MAG TPA: pantetheine-phosphate adenylyltransferase [Aquifex aeolicus]|nr:pantetheine-phosphate adenylyltransferase [Aquificales bacterium]HIP86169.1 pantetheine-phosphate adenylyltransferase [Aquifex sp.]HIQ26398.1 pantetheine-phosphate adenylyltransferase [Aquifex aeolicus]